MQRDSCTTERRKDVSQDYALLLFGPPFRTLLTSRSGASSADAGFGAGIPGPNFGIVTGPFSLSKPVKLLQPGPPLSQMTSVSLRKVYA